MNQETAQALYNQVMELWVHPEILARQEKGEATLPVTLTAVQVVLGMDGSYMVRLNGEVKGTLIARYKRDMRAGEYVTYADIEDLHLEKRDPDDLDFGHITMISQGDNKWNVSFSFIYGAENVKNYLNLGKEFLDQSKAALETSSRSALALATTAGENLLKARLATSPIVNLRAKTHAALVNLLGQFTKTPTKKPIDPRYNETIKFFHKHFNGVRYDPAYPRVHKATIKKHLRVLELLYAETQSIVFGVEGYSLEQRQIRVESLPLSS